MVAYKLLPFPFGISEPSLRPIFSMVSGPVREKVSLQLEAIGGHYIDLQSKYSTDSKNYIQTRR